jgi:hypothetical protein
VVAALARFGTSKPKTLAMGALQRKPTTCLSIALHGKLPRGYAPWWSCSFAPHASTKSIAVLCLITSILGD